MSISSDKSQVFSGLKALKESADAGEQDQLFRSMGQLFANVYNYCNDDQVSQYDEVLCKLVELVEIEAREHVAKLLAPLERAPGSVVMHLAHDDIKVARPLLEFSNVLSDDDLIEIVEGKTEEHRIIIAGRENVCSRIGDAIADNGGQESLVKLLENESAIIGTHALEKTIHLASDNKDLARRLRNRKNINWDLLKEEISSAGAKVLSELSLAESPNGSKADSVSDVVYNRMRSKAGFSASEWKIAYNQVKALNDRRQLNTVALSRFVRFGYGHHVAAAMTIMMNVSTQTFVKWLASQDYVGISVACKVFGLSSELFEGVIALLPWRDAPKANEITDVCARFDNLGQDDAIRILKLWQDKSRNSHIKEVV